MYICMYILTVCSPVNSMNESPSLHMTGLCKLEMVVILKNMTIYVHARENYMHMPGRTICTCQACAYSSPWHVHIVLPGMNYIVHARDELLYSSCQG